MILIVKKKRNFLFDLAAARWAGSAPDPSGSSPRPVKQEHAMFTGVAAAFPSARSLITTIVALVCIGMSATRSQAQIAVNSQFRKLGNPVYEYDVKGYGTATTPAGATAWSITVTIERVVQGGPNVPYPPAQTFSGGHAATNAPWDTGWYSIRTPPAGGDDYIIRATGTYTLNGVDVNFAPVQWTDHIDP